MTFRTRMVSALAGAGMAAAALFYAPSAAADRVGFNVTFGGPGYAVSVGNHGAGFGYYDYAPPVVVAPYAPAYVAPYYAPVYRPYRPYYAPVVVSRPVVVHRHSHYRNDYRDGRYDRRHRSNDYRGYDRYDR